MPALALILVIAFLAVVFPLRSLRRRALFGSAEPVGYIRDRPRSWVVADLMFLAGFGFVLAGPALELFGATGPLWAMPGVALIAGTAFFASATGLAIWSQETMGSAWRPDIAPGDGGQVVVDGPFRWVRNPNYVAMLICAGSSLILAPSAIGLAGCLVLLAGLILTARAEEPPLRRVYGPKYMNYAARTGRFIPGIGRLQVTDTLAAAGDCPPADGA